MAAAKHGGKGRRGWQKLHLGDDGAGMIVAQVLTDSSVDDAVTRLTLIDQVEDDIARFTADAAYDTIAIYDAAVGRGAKVVVPATRSAPVSRREPRSTARDRTVARVAGTGRRRWKKESGYHRQGTVENAFFRYQVIIGDRLRARHSKAQRAEALIAGNILNRMTELGRLESHAIGAWRPGEWGADSQLPIRAPTPMPFVNGTFRDLSGNGDAEFELTFAIAARD